MAVILPALGIAARLAAPSASTVLSASASFGQRADALFDVVGWDNVVRGLFKVSDALSGNAAAINRRALDRMVDLARSRVPQDTGLLYSGIEGREDGDGFEFRASAELDDADYARFVEFGTAAGERGRRIVQGGRSRRQRRGHPGTAAQPYFYNSASEVLADLGREQLDGMIDAMQAEGF